MSIKKTVDQIIEDSIKVVSSTRVIEERSKIKTVRKNGYKIQVQVIVTRDEFDFMD